MTAASLNRLHVAFECLQLHLVRIAIRGYTCSNTRDTTQEKGPNACWCVPTESQFQWKNVETREWFPTHLPSFDTYKVNLAHELGYFDVLKKVNTRKRVQRYHLRLLRKHIRTMYNVVQSWSELMSPRSQLLDEMGSMRLGIRVRLI